MNLNWSRRAARSLTAKIAGRDPSTNIAILRPATPIASPSIAAGEARTGAVALAIGADGTGAPARGSGSSISPGPNGIPAAAA